MPAIAVLVVTWNSAKVIDGLLASLRPGLDGLDWHLVVADNDSADDTTARVEQWAKDNPGLRCQVVNTGGNLGYAAGINAALAKAGQYDAALVLNPDIRLHPGAVAAMYEFIDETAPVGDDAGPRTGIVVPRVLDEDGNLAHSLRREPTLLRALGEATLGARAGRFAPLGELVMDESSYQRPAVADWATGAIMLISAACLNGCGPWDESFFLYSEETEFALRARDRGFLTRLAPRATATHIGGESKVSPELWTLLMSNRVKLYRRRHALPASVAYWGAALLREAPRAALGQERSRSAVKALLNTKVLNQ
jgi:GT2 family glycosyltransferase